MALDARSPLLGPLLDGGGDEAVRVGAASLSWSELRGAALAVAAEVARAGRVAVWATPSLETVVAVAGVLLAGRPAIPLNPSAGPRELGHILADARPDMVLGAPDGVLPGALAAVARRPVDLRARARPGLRAPVEADPEAAALLVYTSGTTGPPKGVLLPRRAIAANLDALARAWAWTETDTVVHGLPLFHVHGLVIGALGALRRGGRLHHVGRWSPAAAAAALQAGGSMLFAVPTMWHRYAAEAEATPHLAEALRRARLLVSGSAALPLRDHEAIRRLTGRGIVERYGLTETLMNCAMRADEAPRPGSVGRPLDNVDLQLREEDGSPLTATGPDAVGEIAVRGPNLFSGYLNRPDATAAVMRDGWFLTGDVATQDADGHVRIVGRRSTDLIKTGGYRVGAGEVEAALLDHPAVAEAAVGGEPDADLGERIVAWVVMRPGMDVADGDLAEHVAALLAPHKRPRRVHRVARLPRNDMGKVVKTELPRRDGAE